MASDDLGAILKAVELSTGESLDPTTFERRLRIQKSVYLLRALGFEPAKHYSFGSYVRGPYSPELARDYYALPAGALKHTNPADIPPRYLNPLHYAVKRGNDFLEAASTLRIYCERNPFTKREEVFASVASLKPNLKDHLGEAWAFLEKHDLLRGRI